MSEEHELHNTLVACEACGREQAESEMYMGKYCDEICEQEHYNKEIENEN